MKAFVGFVLCLIILSWGTARIINNITFGIDCDGHMKRAADANSVELAMQEMRTVVSYLESNGMTSGYTSILYRTPDEDVGFWYKNLKASLQELEAISPQATPLEKSNVLIKLRETLTHKTKESGEITVPSGISIYPHNRAFMWGGVISFIAGAIGFIFLVAGSGWQLRYRY